MIFLSHNKNDKPIVEPIALALAKRYGEDKVFYDSWSIKPGDSILGRMEEGLKHCRYFFFFMTSDSVNSAYCQLEWQSMLTQKLAQPNEIKFIPIRAGQSDIPILLKNLLYLDLYSDGIDATTNNIITILDNNSSFSTKYESFVNLSARSSREGDTLIINICATRFVEHIPDFFLLTKSDIDNVEPDVEGVSMLRHSIWHDYCEVNDDGVFNAIFVGGDHPIIPEAPMKILIYDPDNLIHIDYVVHKKGQKFENIPLN